MSDKRYGVKNLMNRNSETEYEKLIKTYMSKIKEVEICKRTGLKISYISKIKNGKRVPKEYDTLERIMDAINLTGQKRMELTMAYQLERDRSLGMFYKAFTKLHTAISARDYSRITSGR